MSERKNEIDELDQFELLELIERLRSMVWNGDSSEEICQSARELLGEPDDWEYEEN